MHFIPARFAQTLFGLLLSGFMSLLVSGVSTFRAFGLSLNFIALWMNAWVASWLIAFPTVLVVAPLARRLVALLVERPK